MKQDRQWDGVSRLEFSLRRAFTDLGHQRPLFGQERRSFYLGDIQILDRLVGFTVGGEENAVIEGDGWALKIFWSQFLEYVQCVPGTALHVEREGVRGG